MTKHLTDSIIESLQEGNHKAFEIIFLKYFPKVKYYINGFVKSIGIAEELAQNVLLKVWENRKSFNPQLGLKGFDSYIYTISYRTTIDYIRSKQVRDSYYNDQLNNYTEFTDTEDEYIAEETKLLIDMEVEKMPERQRTIFKLSRNEGISNDKIADELNISKRTVENQLSLAMKRIRNILVFIYYLLFII